LNLEVDEYKKLYCKKYKRQIIFFYGMSAGTAERQSDLHPIYTVKTTAPLHCKSMGILRFATAKLDRQRKSANARQRMAMMCKLFTGPAFGAAFFCLQITVVS
jgi:hypothetical protein